MSPNDTLQVLASLIPLLFLSPLLGEWIGRVLEGERHLLSFARPLETAIYRAMGVRETDEMNWKEYLKAILVFSFVGFTVLYSIQMLQGQLPLNPQGFPGTTWHLAFNTAISFVTNTNWQSYGGEATMSYLTQMVGLTVQNFISAATGIAVLVALARGIRAKETDRLGNFWVDLTRSTLYILLPFSFVFAIILIGQGVIQSFLPYVQATTLEGNRQLLAMGPAASQIAIKQLGTNGGGFFNANSAHPLENPTPFSNWLELISILLIPSALPFSFGKWVRSRRHGAVLFATMFLLLLVGLAVSLWSEFLQPGLMEGKEARFGIVNSVLWSVFTTAASNGSVNAMHSSLTPLSGALALTNIILGEVIFGGVGSGLYGMVIFVVLTVFIAGLMVGRTPEYLGKKIESQEVRMAIAGVLAPNVAILLAAGISVTLPMALSSVLNKGPHGLTEILYAFGSAGGNNGSAFAGLNANTSYYNVVLGFVMIVGRFGVIAPVLAIAGALSIKRICPPTSGTFGTESILFVVLLISVILIIGGLTFFPALALGPIVEHFLWLDGKVF